MTPFTAPGAGAKPPAAATPRAQGAPVVAGGPRPMVASYGNLGTPVRVAPSPTPRAQAPPTARMAPGVPIARPRVPLAPHAQGAPVHVMPRPMVRGGAPVAGFGAATQTPRMQAPMTMTRAPGIPPNTLGVGAAAPFARPHVPLLQPTQRAPAVASPAAPSLLGKRAPPTMGPAHIQQAKRQATAPRPQGAPMGGVPPPTNPAAPAVAVRAAPVPPEHAQGAPTAGNATPSRPPQLRPQPKLPYVGVYHDPSKGWMARVMDLKRRAARSLGPFGDPHLAALAQDRAAIACAGRGIGGGGGARLNFEAAFYRVETAFLHRWEGDLCGALEEGTYEESYAAFLRAGYKVALKVKPGDDGGDTHGDELIASCVDDGDVFWDDIEDFFLNRAAEIGKEALDVKDGGKLLRLRFVEMHRNKSLCPEWRRNNLREKLKTMVIQKQQQQQIQMQQQQQPQIQMKQEQQQIQMKQEQQQHIQQLQQQQQIQMQQWQQQKQQQQIQMQQRQQQFQQQQMMIQKQRQQQMMMAQQQQQYVDDDATLQVKKE